MRRWWAWGLAAATALAMGCGNDDGGKDTTGPKDEGPLPDVPGEVAGDTGSDDVPTTGACLACLTPGMTWRFTKVEVTEPSEPDGLPEFLNAIWKPDINAFRLNIMLRIDKIVDEDGGTKLIDFTAGSGWHDLTLADILPVQGGKTPTEFYFVEGATSTFQARLKADCSFDTIGDTNLLPFHPGTKDEALICSAGNEGIGLPKDTIPIANLVASGRIDDTCEHVIDATLDGCIGANAACEICNFLTAPDYQSWSYQPTGATPPKSCDSTYCEAACGRSGSGTLFWVNFGGFVQGLGVPTACKVGEEDAYKLKGSWAATKVKTKAD